MDRHSIQTSIFSITAPGVCVVKDPNQARALARKCNEQIADICATNPARYGFFATVPSLLDTEGAIEEIKYALETLKADGICLFTRYGDGMQYLGNPAFKPVWKVLDDYKAVVFVHPTHPTDTRTVNAFVPQATLDYPHETTRAAVDMITQGTVQTYAAHCRIILSHAGGSLPFLAARPANSVAHSTFAKRNGLDITPEQFYEAARRFYYDCATAGSSIQLTALLSFVSADHVFFGSDFPYAPIGAIDRHIQLNDEYAYPAGVQEAVMRGNAIKLLPRLGK